MRITAETNKNTNSVSNSKLLRSFGNMIDDLLEKMYREGYSKEVNELSLKYIKTSKESLKGKKENIFYPMVFEKIFQSIVNKFYIEDINEIKSILSEIKYSGISHDGELLRYNNLYFNSLIRNRHISTEELQNFKKSFINELLFNVNYNEEDTLKSIELKTLYMLLKRFTYEENKADINSFLNLTFTKEKLSRNGLFNKLVIVLFLYVYYLGIRENDVKLDKKNALISIFRNEIFIEGKEIRSIIERIDLDDLWSFYTELYKEFSTGGWELLKENEVKQLSIHKNVNEFFLFLSVYLNSKFGSFYDENIFKSLDWNRLNELIIYFDKSGKIKSKHIENFEKLVMLLEKDHEELKAELNQLVEEAQFGIGLLNVFKKLFVEKIVQKKIETTANFASTIQKEKEEINKRFDSWVFKDINKISEDENIYKTISINEKFFTTTLSIDYFDENTISLGLNLSDLMLHSLEYKLISYIKEYVEIKEINFKDQGKIANIINIIQDDVKVNSRISSDKIIKTINFTESDVDIELFNSKINLLSSYGTFTDLPFDFYFNEQLLSFKDLSISIDIRDFTEEEVNEIIEEKELNNKGYIVEIGYGAEIHLDKVQFHEYYINNFFKMDVYVKGEILLKAGKVGYLFTLEKL